MLGDIAVKLPNGAPPPPVKPLASPLVGRRSLTTSALLTSKVPAIYGPSDAAKSALAPAAATQTRSNMSRSPGASIDAISASGSVNFRRPNRSYEIPSASSPVVESFGSAAASAASALLASPAMSSVPSPSVNSVWKSPPGTPSLNVFSSSVSRASPPLGSPRVSHSPTGSLAAPSERGYRVTKAFGYDRVSSPAQYGRHSPTGSSSPAQHYASRQASQAASIGSSIQTLSGPSMQYVGSAAARSPALAGESIGGMKNTSAFGQALERAFLDLAAPVAPMGAPWTTNGSAQVRSKPQTRSISPILSPSSAGAPRLFRGLAMQQTTSTTTTINRAGVPIQPSTFGEIDTVNELGQVLERDVVQTTEYDKKDRFGRVVERDRVTEVDKFNQYGQLVEQKHFSAYTGKDIAPPAFGDVFERFFQGGDELLDEVPAGLLDEVPAYPVADPVAPREAEPPPVAVVEDVPAPVAIDTAANPIDMPESVSTGIPDMTEVAIALEDPTRSYSRDVLERSLAAEGVSASALDQRLKQLELAISLKASKTESRGDNIAPIASLQVSRSDMWVFLQLAHHLVRVKTELEQAQGSRRPLCAGIVAPAGGGKSTLVTLLRMLVSEVLEAGAAEEVSIDDFLSSGPADQGADRSRYNIRTRWDIHSTDEDIGVRTLQQLRANEVDESMTVPRFQLATDTRMFSETRTVTGRVDFILFEGWRVGVHHPNFFGMNAEIDTLVYLESDFSAVLNFKKEKIKRDIAASGFNLYDLIKEKYGLEVDDVFDKHYFATAHRYIVPVMQHADVVLRKGASHNIEAVTWQTQRWADRRKQQSVEDVEVALISDGKSSLSCAFPTFKITMQYIVDYTVLFTSKGPRQVKELTRGWAGKWIMELADGTWLRASVVLCGPLRDPTMWAAQLAEPRGEGCPWDGLPATVSSKASFPNRKSIAEIETGAILVLGIQSDLRDALVDGLKDSYVYIAQEH